MKQRRTRPHIPPAPLRDNLPYPPVETRVRSLELLDSGLMISQYVSERPREVAHVEYVPTERASQERADDGVRAERASPKQDLPPELQWWLSPRYL